MDNNKKIKVGNLVLGEGKPKICVPITGKDLAELRKGLDAVSRCEYDLAEWRIDCFDKWNEPELLTEAFTLIRSRLSDKPLILTFRSASEGGKSDISSQDYVDLYRQLLDIESDDRYNNVTNNNCGVTDTREYERTRAKHNAAESESDKGERLQHIDNLLIDGELNRWMDESLQQIIELSHKRRVPVICSHHNFEKTPSYDRMWDILTKMNSTGADINKLAVMPKSPLDVIELMRVTAAFNAGFPERPIITMSMGALGAISRVSGSLTGSCLTFAAAGETSAPGQLTVDETKTILNVLY